MFSSFRASKPRQATHNRTSFMEPMNRLSYHEDYYGRRNREEFDEGPIDKCDSDDDSDGEKRVPSNRFFRQFATPRGKVGGTEGFGQIRKGSGSGGGKRRGYFNNDTFNSPATPTRAPRQEDIQSASPTRQNHSKNLLPKKNMFGMFAAPTARMPADNSAGEALDDMMGTAGLNDSDLDDTIDFGEGGEDGATMLDSPMSTMGAAAQLPPNPYVMGASAPLPPNPYVIDAPSAYMMRGALNQSDDEPMLQPEASMDGGGNGGGGRGRGRPAALMSPEGDGDGDGNGDGDAQSAANEAAEPQSAAEGDLEDNASEAGDDDEVRTTKAKSSAADTGGGSKSKGKAATMKTAKMPYILRRRVLDGGAISSSDASAPRRSGRRSVVVEKGTSIRSPATRAKQIAASNRFKMTARAVAMREKAKKSPEDKQLAQQGYFQAAYGRKRRVSKIDTTGDEKAEYRNASGRKSKMSKERQGGDDDPKTDYYRAVYGRRKRSTGAEQEEDEPQYADVADEATAAAMEARGGRVETLDEGVDVAEYERVD